jgi:hypothetical protein
MLNYPLSSHFREQKLALCHAIACPRIQIAQSRPCGSQSEFGSQIHSFFVFPLPAYFISERAKDLHQIVDTVIEGINTKSRQKLPGNIGTIFFAIILPII